MEKKRVPVDLAAHEQQLVDKLRFLKRCCSAYDAGDLSEFCNMASHLRLLLWSNERNSTSLLRHLGLDGSYFVSTAARYNPKSITQGPSLVFSRTTMGPSGSSITFLPFLDDVPWGERAIPLSEWLEKEVIFRDLDGNEFNRLTFIRTVAEQDGGVHVDASIDAKYAALKEGVSIGLRLMVDGKERSVPGIERPILRQISHEALRSIDEIFQRYLGNKLCSCDSGRKARYCCMKRQEQK